MSPVTKTKPVGLVLTSGVNSFSPLPRSDTYAAAGFQNDMRMSYCASVVSDVARGGIDRASSVRYIKQCRTWEGGYGARPGLEAQGGSLWVILAHCPGGTTYCAVTSLGPEAEGRSDTLRWLLQRQIGGFQGRPGKLEDVCYSFWCGAAVAVRGPGGITADSSYCKKATSSTARQTARSSFRLNPLSAGSERSQTTIQTPSIPTWPSQRWH